MYINIRTLKGRDICIADAAALRRTHRFLRLSRSGSSFAAGPAGANRKNNAISTA